MVYIHMHRFLLVSKVFLLFDEVGRAKLYIPIQCRNSGKASGAKGSLLFVDWRSRESKRARRDDETIEMCAHRQCIQGKL